MIHNPMRQNLQSADKEYMFSSFSFLGLSMFASFICISETALIFCKTMPKSMKNDEIEG
jgi:hypothetical protein